MDGHPDLVSHGLCSFSKFMKSNDGLLEDDVSQATDMIDEESQYYTDQGPTCRHETRSNFPFAFLSKIIILGFSLYGMVTLLIELNNYKSTPSTDVQRFQAIYDSHYAPSYTTEPCYCGTSTTEARELGCTYDELSAGWLPPHCRDDELTDEFGSKGDGNGTWNYYADKERTQLLTMDEVGAYADKQPQNFHMSVEWHKWHCLYLWRKEHRFKALGKVYDPRSDTEHHVLHCMQILMGESNGTAAGASLVG